MKIATYPLLNRNVLSVKFGKIVDYGAKDKDLVYVPILFDESDSFSKTTTVDDGTMNTEKTLPKSKFKKLVNATGSTIAAFEVVPEVINGICDKCSTVIDKTEELTNKAINSTASIKENYKEKFNNHKDNSELSNQFDDTEEDITPFPSSSNLNNSNSEYKLNYEDAQDVGNVLDESPSNAEEDIDDEDLEEYDDYNEFDF